jgi:A/G-specific adenine glycosylase
LRTRPEKGLLGGMTEVPSTEWTHACDEAAALRQAPLSAAWRRLPGVVAHTFTHFPLELAVYTARMPARARAPHGMRWVALADLAQAALPSVMRKVIVHADIRSGGA